MNERQHQVRALLVIGSLQAGGAERVLASIANGLADRGIEATVLTIADPASDFYRLSDSVKRRYPVGAKGRLPKLLKFQWELRLGTKEADIVLSFLTETNIASSLWSLLYGRPAIVSERIHPEFNSSGWRRTLMTVASLVYRRPSIHVVVQSPGIASAFQSAGVSAEVIANGVEVPAVFPAWESRAHVVVVVGSLSKRKRVADVLRAWSSARLFERGWVLRIVGDGPLRRELESLAAELGLVDSVDFLGQQRDVASLLRYARIFVSASEFEGTSNALLEAMAQGCACIVSDCPGDNRELMDMERGAMFPMGDFNALANELVRIASDTFAGESYGSAAYLAAKLRNWEDAQARWCDLVEARSPRR